jgi:phage terminase large subunit-like protein
VTKTSTKDSLNALKDGLAASRDIDGAIRRFLAEISAAERERLWKAWRMDARPGDQKPPEGEWLTWLMLGGRGAGKTRAGAEFVRGLAMGIWPFADDPTGPIALIGETYADVREVMIEGVSGILARHPSFERPVWVPSRRRLEWRSGVVAQAFSSEDPEALRGPQFAAAWGDELGKWRHAEETWDMLQFGLRLGARPRQMVTTTPRAIPLLRRLINDPTTRVTHATTAMNAGNLSATFLGRVVARYEGTRLGRQELLGELIEERSDALFRREEIEAGRVERPPELRRIVVAVDPPASARSGTCGIVAAGVTVDGVGYVIADRTIKEVRPTAWAAQALGAYRMLDADALVAEVNQGGDMVESVLREVDPGVPVTKVRATRGKWLRAEPVAALYAQGRVRHAGVFRDLEDEMCDFGPDGLSSGRSPDRLDALVWAITALMLGEEGEPRVRGM